MINERRSRCLSRQTKMFFNCEDMSINILGVFKLNWYKRDKCSRSRPFHALSFRIRGNSTMISLDGSQIQFKTNDIAFVPAMHLYRQKALQEELYVIHFTCDQITETEIKKLSPKRPESFERLFADIYEAWSKKQQGYIYECKSKLYKIIFKMECDWNDQKILSTNDKISEAVEYIHDHFTDHSLTVEYLAQSCGMSDTYFRKIFLSIFDTTPLKYINQLRMKHADELLRSDYYTIEEISEICGFNNINYFSRFIKKQTGYSPSVYRQHMKDRI